MLVTIFCIVISITAFSVTKSQKLKQNRKKAKLNCGNTKYQLLVLVLVKKWSYALLTGQMKMRKIDCETYLASAALSTPSFSAWL
jgi:hypothetical protein